MFDFVIPGPQNGSTSSPAQKAEDNCHCIEEVEAEEAKALAQALEASTSRQAMLPFIPGLSRMEGQETVVIRVQDEVGFVQ